MCTKNGCEAFVIFFFFFFFWGGGGLGGGGQDGCEWRSEAFVKIQNNKKKNGGGGGGGGWGGGRGVWGWVRVDVNGEVKLL